MLKKVLKWLGIALLLLVSAFVFMIGPRNIIGILRYDQREEGTLQVGQPAPDLKLHPLDGSAARSLLAEAGGKPLVVVFGSFT